MRGPAQSDFGVMRFAASPMLTYTVTTWGGMPHM